MVFFIATLQIMKKQEICNQGASLSLSLANWQQPLANIDSPSTHSHFQGMCWFRIIEQHPPCGREPPARTMPYHLKSARAAEGGDGTDSG